MCGKFVLWLNFILILCGASSASGAWVQLQIKNDQAMVYNQPNFDAEVLAYMPERKRFKVDNKPVNGYFYKIEYAPKKFGFIVDTDLIISKKNQTAPKQSVNKKTPRTVPRKSKKKSFDSTRYVGFTFLNMTYRETALGAVRKSTLPMYGLKISGPDTLFSGPIDSDFNILITKEMPDYYKKKTGREATGTLLIFDFSIYSGAPIGQNAFFYYGFGPLLKYSKIYSDRSGDIKGQQVVDVGLVIPVGLAFRLGPVALKPEAVYYFEKNQYNSLGLSLQMEF